MHVFAKKTLKRLYKTLSALVFLRLGLSGRERGIRLSHFYILWYNLIPGASIVLLKELDKRNVFLTYIGIIFRGNKYKFSPYKVLFAKSQYVLTLIMCPIHNSIQRYVNDLDIIMVSSVSCKGRCE